MGARPMGGIEAALPARVRRFALAAGFIIVVVGVLKATVSALDVQLNSDLLYPASIYRDLVAGTTLRWNLPPAPYFVPDLALFYAVARAGGSADAAYAFYGVAFFALFFAAIVRLLRHSGRDWSARVGWALVASLFLVAQLIDSHPATRVFFIPVFHAGTLLVGILLLDVVLTVLDDGFTLARAIVFFLLTWLGALSDLFLVLQFVLPMAAVVAAEGYRGRVEKHSLRVGAALLATAAAAVLLSVRALSAFTPLRFFGNPFYEVVGKSGAPPAFVDMPAAQAAALVPSGWPTHNLATFAHDLARLFATDPLLWIVLALAVGASCLAQRSVASRFARFFLAQVVIVLVEVGLSWVGLGKSKYSPLAVVDEGTLRHMQPLFILPPFVLTFYAATFAHGSKRFIHGAVLLAIVSAGVILVRHPSSLVAKTSYPEAIRCVDRIATERHLTAGWGDYWTARHIQALSRAGLHIDSVLPPRFEFDRWVVNLAWYLPSGNVPSYAFFVPPRYEEPMILRRFGPPAETIDCAGIHLFLYDRPQDIAVRNFLRVPSLVENGRQPPSLLIGAPALNEWKPDGAPRASGVAVGDGLELKLDRPHLANVVELSGDGGTGFEVDARGDGGVLLARVTVETPAGAGLVRGFASLGEGPRRQPIASLRVRARSGEARIGHLFVYLDDAR